MILLVSSNGSIIHQTQERVFKGSVRANQVDIIAPFPITTTMTISFETPNGYTTPFVPMERDEQFITSDGQYLWSINLDAPVTDYAGQVKFSFKATRLFTELGTTYTETLASGNGIFYVENNASPDLPAEPDVDVYDIILQAITDLQNGKVSRQSITEIEDYEPNGYKAPNFLYYDCEYTINSTLLKGALLVTNSTTIVGEVSTIIQSEYFHTSNKIYSRILTIVDGVVTVVGSWIESTVTQALLDRVTVLETSMEIAQSDINTAQNNINTLQSDMITAQSQLTELEKERLLSLLYINMQAALENTTFNTSYGIQFPLGLVETDLQKYGFNIANINFGRNVLLGDDPTKVLNIYIAFGRNPTLLDYDMIATFRFGRNLNSYNYINISNMETYHCTTSWSEVGINYDISNYTYISDATINYHGLMSSTDKTKLDAVPNNIPSDISTAISNHNTSGTAHEDIRAIAEGARIALSFDSIAQLEEWIAGTYTRPDDILVSELVIGQNIYSKINTENDYWVSNIPVTSLADLTPLETDKIDLTDYLAKDNTTAYTPTGDYNPATKAYADTKEPLLPTRPTIDADINYLRADNIWSPISIGNGGYASNVYPTNLTSTTEPTYKQLSYVNDIATTEVPIIVNNNELLVGTYIYDIELGTTIIDAGTWSFDMYAKVNALTPTGSISRLKLVIFSRNILGTETALFTTYSSNLSSTDYSRYKFETDQPQFTVASTDKLGIRVYANTTRVLDTTITFMFGDGNTSYFNTPLKLRHNQLRDLNGDINFLHITSTEKASYAAKQNANLLFADTAVLTTDFVADTTYDDYGFRASITLAGVVSTDIPQVVLGVTEADSGEFASVSSAYAGGIYIYAKSVPSATITIPTILIVKGA